MASSASEAVLAELQGAFGLVADPAPTLASLQEGAKELEALRARTVRAEAQAKALQAHVLSVEGELSAVRGGGGGGGSGAVPLAASADTQGAEMALLSQENAALKQQLAAREAELVRTATQLSDAKLAMASSGSGASEEAAALRSKLTRTEEELMRTAAALSDAKLALADRPSAPRPTVPDERVAALQKHAAELEARLKISAEEATVAAQELALLTQSESEALQETASLREQLAASAGLQAQLDEATQHRTAMERKLEHMQSNAQALLEAVEQEQQRRMALDDEHAKLRAAFAELKRQQPAQLQTTADLEAVREALAAANASRNEMASELERVRGELAEARAQAERGEADAAAQQATTALESERARCMELAAAHAQVSARVLELDRARSAAESTIHALRAEIQAGQGQQHEALSAAQHKVAQLSAAVAALEATHHEDATRLAAARADATRATADLSQAREALKSVEASAAEQQAALRREVEAAHKDASVAAQHLAQVRVELEAAKHHSNPSDVQRVQALQGELDAAKQHSATLSVQLTSAHAELEAARVQAARVRELEATAATETRRAEALTAQLSQSGDAQAKALTGARAELQTAQQTIAVLQGVNAQVLAAVQASLKLAPADAAAVDAMATDVERVGALTTHIMTLRAQHAILSAQAVEWKEKALRVQKDYDEVRARADSAVDQVRGDNAKLARDLDELMQRYNALAAADEAGEWKRRCAAAEAALEEKKTVLADVKTKSSAALTAMREQNAQLTAKLQALAAADAESASEATRELRAQNEQLQHKLSEMIGTLEQTRRQDEEIVAKNRELMHSLDVLQAEHEQAAKLAAAAPAAALAAATAGADHAALLQSRLDLETERAHAQQLQDTITTLQKSVERHEQASAQASSRAAIAEAELSKHNAAQVRDTTHTRELEALRREKRQLERDNRENLELVERLQKEKFQTLEMYSQAQRSCEELQATAAALEEKLRGFDASRGSGEHHAASGAAAPSASLVSLGGSVASQAAHVAGVAWRRVGQCVPPLSSLPTVQRVSALFVTRTKEKDEADGMV